MIPQETKDRILDLTKVEEVIGDFVSLRRQGANYLACCPFHNEKTPSFSVSPSKGFYYCFGCHKGGSAVTFLMEHEAMSYTEALRYLGKKYNVEVVEEDEDPETILARQRKESLYLVSEFAAKFFAEQLKDGEGRAAGYNYFRSRSMEDATIEKFGLGWCPSNKTALRDAAVAAGYKEEYLVDVGVCVRTEDGRVYDRFHDRAIFPIYSDSGRVIAFGGRTLFSDYKERRIGKYINSPETDIYVKSKTLYGLFQAKSSIGREDKCILVEGNIDVISMHQLGITNVVASCGTSLTVDHIRRIKRFTNNMTIIYDGDAAGIHAAIRGVGMVLQEGLNVKVVVLPDGKDPDDFCKEHTLEEAKAFIASHEQDFINFKIDVMLDEAGDDPIRRAQVINDIADTVALIPDAVSRSVYMDVCSRRLEIEREVIKSRVEFTAGRLKEEEWKRKENESRQKAPEAQPEERPETVDVNLPGATGKRLATQFDHPLAPLEKNLLEFILNNGLDPLTFPSDHKLFCDPPMTVADFIDSSLAEDNVVFQIPAYRKTYEEYFVYYDEGLDQDSILKKLVNDEDVAVTSTVAELTSRRYEVTEKNLKASLTSESTVLVHGVPKTIMLYQLKIWELKQDQINEQMKQPGADVMSLIRELQDIQKICKSLKTETGRL